MDIRSVVPVPRNEPVRQYRPDSTERRSIEAELHRVGSMTRELPMIVGGDHRLGSGDPESVVAPHLHEQLLGSACEATGADAAAAIEAARAAASGWAAASFDERAAVFLRAAELLAGPWRDRLNAATMLGQSKTVYQAEIDAACELIDFWRFNVAFAQRLAEDQPLSAPGVWNRVELRPLEGFVYAVTPFNFTSIAGNLPTAPALMGNVVLWKPATTSLLAAVSIMELLEAAGLPPGVINLVTGHGRAVTEVALAAPDLAGIHFTGSTSVFQSLWQQVGSNIASYRSYPRLVGETGGKDFVLAHPSADPDVLRVAMLRGAFEYQGQKCSAASRAYVPQSVWDVMGEAFLADVESIKVGPVTDFTNFMGAVIDERAYRRITAAIERARLDPRVEIAAGGQYDESSGWFVRPTVLLCSDPTSEYFKVEYFGPILAVHVFPDADYESVVAQLESVAPYALTGSVIATDRAAISSAMRVLRFAAGNFYVNDKPTGAVVGQQPFGGARASGTNDKAGSAANLMRWTNLRSIKENFVPPTQYRYPHQG